MQVGQWMGSEEERRGDEDGRRGRERERENIHCDDEPITERGNTKDEDEERDPRWTYWMIGD